MNNRNWMIKCTVISLNVHVATSFAQNRMLFHLFPHLFREKIGLAPRLFEVPFSVRLGFQTFGCRATAFFATGGCQQRHRKKQANGQSNTGKFHVILKILK